jgi:hypothetical protein
MSPQRKTEKPQKRGKAISLQPLDFNTAVDAILKSPHKKKAAIKKRQKKK